MSKQINDEDRLHILGYVENEPLCISFEEISTILQSDCPATYLSIFLCSEWAVKFNATKNNVVDALFISEKLKLPVADVERKLKVLAANNLLSGGES